MSGEIVQSWLGTFFQAVTAVGVMYAIWTGVQAKRAAVWAAHQAEDAAVAAAKHANENVTALGQVAENVQKIEIATNSMKDALIHTTAIASDLAGERRGIEIGRAAAEKAADDLRNAPLKED
jgi:hypothetical protein